MKNAILLILALSSLEAYAGCTTRTIGSTAYTDCDNGTSYTANKIGGTTYYRGDINATSNTMGGTTYYNGDINGSSYKAGSTTYYNTDKGNGSTYSLGNRTYNNNGNSCYYVGSVRYCN